MRFTTKGHRDMATFHKFDQFVEYLAEKVYNLQADTLRVCLTNVSPYSSNTVKQNITEIAAGSGYSSGGAVATLVSSTQIAGVYKLVLNDVTFTASGGSIGPFQYFVLYDDTASNDELIGWWDYGASITLGDGETVTVDFSSASGVLQIS
jgi:hypothetical protein